MGASAPSATEQAVKGGEQSHPHGIKDEFSYSEEAVLFNEEPKPINGDTLKEILHMSVGALTYLNKDNKLVTGSGVLISKNTFLTAAHHIFDRGSNVENSGFKLYFMADGVAEDYYEVEEWRFP